MCFPAAQDWRSIWRNLALWALLAGRHTTQTCIQWKLSTPPPPSIHPTVCSNTILRFPIRAKVVPTVKTDKSHRTCQCHLLGAAIICFPYIQSRMQTCRKSSMAGNDAPDPLSQQLARWEWLKKEIWDCWERGAENQDPDSVSLCQVSHCSVKGLRVVITTTVEII